MVAPKNSKKAKVATSAKKSHSTSGSIVRAKQFIATIPKKYLYITVAAVIVIGGATVVLQPKRTEAKFCSTLNEGMSGIESRYQSASGGGTMKEMGTLSGNLSEFSKLLRDLNEVAPPEIEKDMKVVAESWDKNMDDGAKNGATAVTSPLGALANGLAGGIMNAIKNGASYNAVDTYSKEHCGRGLFSGTGATGASGSTEESNIIDLNTTDIAKFKPWENNQKGIIVRYNGKLNLIDIEGKKLTARLTLPDEKGRTSATDDGRPYSLQYTASMPFSNDFRYIAAKLYPVCNVGDSNCFDKPEQVAYYDMKDGKVTPTGVIAYNTPEYQSEYAKIHGGTLPRDFTGISTIKVDTIGDKGFDKRGFLVTALESGYFIATPGDNNRGYYGDLAYDIASKTLVHPIKEDASILNNPDITAFSYYENKKDVLVYTPKGGVEIRYNGGGISTTFPCSEILGLISKTKLLCNRGGTIDVLDIANIANNKTKKDDPNSPEYRVGRTYYDVKDSVTISVDDDFETRPISPDFKKIAFIRKEAGGEVLYIADLSSGESTKIGVLKTSDTARAEALGWR